ncbi:hypothetical protein [Streptomyces sp. NPDC057257]|uniref:hypothetical protein n=1 Tax=Streptomyces sp. NPDC057257 TaxID=3346071 RepID=UPI003637429F
MSDWGAAGVARASREVGAGPGGIGVAPSTGRKRSVAVVELGDPRIRSVATGAPAERCSAVPMTAGGIGSAESMPPTKEPRVRAAATAVSTIAVALAIRSGVSQASDRLGARCSRLPGG